MDDHSEIPYVRDHYIGGFGGSDNILHALEDRHKTQEEEKNLQKFTPINYEGENLFSGSI